MKIIPGGAVKSAYEAYNVRFNSHPKTISKSGYLITFVCVSALQKIKLPSVAISSSSVIATVDD